MPRTDPGVLHFDSVDSVDSVDFVDYVWEAHAFSFPRSSAKMGM
jgi:hypothetical protein